MAGQRSCGEGRTKDSEEGRPRVAGGRAGDAHAWSAGLGVSHSICVLTRCFLKAFLRKNSPPFHRRDLQLGPHLLTGPCRACGLVEGGAHGCWADRGSRSVSCPSVHGGHNWGNQVTALVPRSQGHWWQLEAGPSTRPAGVTRQPQPGASGAFLRARPPHGAGSVW